MQEALAINNTYNDLGTPVEIGFALFIGDEGGGRCYEPPFSRLGRVSEEELELQRALNQIDNDVTNHDVGFLDKLRAFSGYTDTDVTRFKETAAGHAG